MIIITIIIPSPPHDESLCSLTFREKKSFEKNNKKLSVLPHAMPSPNQERGNGTGHQGQSPALVKGLSGFIDGPRNSTGTTPQWQTHGFWAHSQVHIWGFPKMVVPNNHGFSYWKWSFWGVLGVPPFRKHPYKYVGAHLVVANILNHQIYATEDSMSSTSWTKQSMRRTIYLPDAWMLDVYGKIGRDLYGKLVGKYTSATDH